MSELNKKKFLNKSHYDTRKNANLYLNNHLSQTNFPVEILYKVFDSLNIVDLIKCSEVCKKWNEISNEKYFWLKWSEKYGFNDELIELIKSHQKMLPKILFMKIMIQKRNLYLFKQLNKIKMKTNRFTYLPDLNYQTIKDDVSTWLWYLEFYDKKNNCLFSLKNDEKNLFECSLSLLWYSSNLQQLVGKFSKEIQRMKILAEVPVYVDLISGNLVTNRKTILNINKNNKEILFDIEITNMKQFIFKKDNVNYFHEDSIIKLGQLRHLLLGLWKSNEIAFLTFNPIFDYDLLEKVFQIDTNNKKMSFVKSNDYTIYLNIRNQTKSSFLRLNKTSHKSKTIKLGDAQENNYIQLSFLDCDFINDIGPEFTMLPKFTWKTEVLSKNDIDFVSIFDLSLFDWKKNVLFSECFPIKICKQLSNNENQFLTNDSYEAKFQCDDFIFECIIISLKDEYTNSSNNISYHMKKLDLYLPLKL